jgi:hypothetical protein
MKFLKQNYAVNAILHVNPAQWEIVKISVIHVEMTIIEKSCLINLAIIFVNVKNIMKNLKIQVLQPVN